MLGRFLFTTVPGSILLGSMIISISILVSFRSLKANKTADLKSDQNTAQVETGKNKNPSGEIKPTLSPEAPVKINIAGDPVLGDKNAPLTLVLFSDYECPFCKKAFEEVLPSLKDNYIKSGKLRLVYKDLPLPFHQNAAKEAEAALCARDQKGDEIYFKYHDLLFTNTTGGGIGINLSELPDFARQLDLDVSRFQECLDKEKFKEEVGRDLDEAVKAGASGTPTWFLGRTKDDFEGIRIIGALPFASFKQLIDKELSEI